MKSSVLTGAGISLALIGALGWGLTGAVNSHAWSVEYDTLVRESEETAAEMEAERESLRSREAAVAAGEESLEQSLSMARQIQATEQRRLDADRAELEERESVFNLREEVEMQGGGAWVVGLNLAPGSYQTAADVDGYCSWQINPLGSLGERETASGTVDHGRPVITLAAGDVLFLNEYLDCGTWKKVG